MLKPALLFSFPNGWSTNHNIILSTSISKSAIIWLLILLDNFLQFPSFSGFLWCGKILWFLKLSSKVCFYPNFGFQRLEHCISTQTTLWKGRCWNHQVGHYLTGGGVEILCPRCITANHQTTMPQMQYLFQHNFDIILLVLHTCLYGLVNITSLSTFCQASTHAGFAFDSCPVADRHIKLFLFQNHCTTINIVYLLAPWMPI